MHQSAISRRPSRASETMERETCSSWLPLGMPRASRVIRRPEKPLSLSRKKRAVPSPSKFALVARMTSLTPRSSIRERRAWMVKSAGVTPSSGAKAPRRT